MFIYDGGAAVGCGAVEGRELRLNEAIWRMLGMIFRLSVDRT